MKGNTSMPMKIKLWSKIKHKVLVCKENLILVPISNLKLTSILSICSTLFVHSSYEIKLGSVSVSTLDIFSKSAITLQLISMTFCYKKLNQHTWIEGKEHPRRDRNKINDLAKRTDLTVCYEIQFLRQKLKNI